jgi:type III secretion system YscQ/HrcQ family protein
LLLEERGDEPLSEIWSWLPRFPARHVRLENRVSHWTDSWIESLIDWLGRETSQPIELGRPEMDWRASGLRRPGLIAQIRWPGLNTRMAVGVETPLAHAVVDGLLAYDRPLAESRLQLTPVEWGVWSYLAIRALQGLASDLGESDPSRQPLVHGPDPRNLLLDRVGPDPFDPAGLGAVVTLRWAVRVGSTAGTVRAWFPEWVFDLIPIAPLRRQGGGPDAPSPNSGTLSSLWRAEAGFVEMPHGLRKLRVGGVLPFASSRLTGTPQSPTGPISLVCDLSGNVSRERHVLPAEPVASSGGRLVRLTGLPTRQDQPRDALNLGINETMNGSAPHPADRGPTAGSSPETSPLDVPVTLTVELGRVNLSLNRLADLKPGDVIELGRHSREPVELTSNGRLVARGELLLIDTELGVRVTHIFL